MKNINFTIKKYLSPFVLMSLGILLLNSPLLLAQEEECLNRRMTDSLVLVNFYEATDGPSWGNNWDLEEPIDEWYGVILDEENCGVEALELANNGLKGELSELYFPLLKLMDLSDNELTGILTDFDLFPFIEKIYLNNNQFFGTVPFFDEFEDLETVDISNNFFTFEGMEELASSNIEELIYNPQASISLTLAGNKLEVEAGGNINNNTYNWYRDGELWISLIGDNDVLISEEGDYSVMVRNSEVTELGDANRELFLFSDTLNYVADCTIPDTPTLVVDETVYCVEEVADIIFYVKQIEVPEDFYFQWFVNGNSFVNNTEFEQVFIGAEVSAFEVNMRLTNGIGCNSEFSNTIDIVVEVCEGEDGPEGEGETIEIGNIGNIGDLSDIGNVGTGTGSIEDGCPELPTPYLTSNDTIICEGNSAIIAIGPDPESCIIEVYQDGMLLLEQKDSILVVTESGDYLAFFIDPNGCKSDRSNTISIDFVECEPLDCENDTIFECSTGLLDPITVCPDFCQFPDNDFAITSVTTNHFSCSINILDQFCASFRPLPAFMGLDTLRIIACDVYGLVCDTTFVVINVTENCAEGSGGHGIPDNFGSGSLFEIKDENRSQGQFSLISGGERYFGDDLIHIYPNPAQAYVYVNFGTKELSAYQIYNVLGEKVAIGDFEGIEERSLTLDVTQYHSGLYFIEIFEDGKESKIYQFIVE